MSYDFTTTTQGKWILAGEHAVLRGKPALVFPLKSQQLILNYQVSSSPLILTHSGLQNQHLHPIVWRVLEEGLSLLNLSLTATELTGKLHINNQIPLGEGLGASAALCVAIARWFQNHFAPTLEVFDFAKQLEHLFHGQSSGLDIAAASSTQGIYFQQSRCTPIPMLWSPHWTLSSCGEVGITSRSIQLVQKLRQENALRANEIDEQMEESVTRAHLALLHQDNTLLAEAITTAGNCFEAWGLITPALATHMQKLREAGAIAVKPTGSGGGGYILSLWEQVPPKTLGLTSLILI